MNMDVVSKPVKSSPNECNWQFIKLITFKHKNVRGKNHCHELSIVQYYCIHAYHCTIKIRLRTVWFPAKDHMCVQSCLVHPTLIRQTFSCAFPTPISVHSGLTYQKPGLPYTWFMKNRHGRLNKGTLYFLGGCMHYMNWKPTRLCTGWYHTSCRTGTFTKKLDA